MHSNNEYHICLCYIFYNAVSIKSSTIQKSQFHGADICCFIQNSYAITNANYFIISMGEMLQEQLYISPAKIEYYKIGICKKEE